MKNLLNSMRKQGGKPIYRVEIVWESKSSSRSEKPLKSYLGKRGGKLGADLIDCLKIGMRDCWRLWIRGLSTTSTSVATKGTATRLGLQRALLLSASLIGSFVWMATLLFWLLFWNR